MGVVGLWQLLNPVGQPVTLESLENKILTVDISIWLNQAVKGYRDAKGGAVTNAHLLSLFNRLCKLLFYKIRPIIVFDGGVPDLKKKTIFSRQQKRSVLKESSRDVAMRLLENYVVADNLKKKSDKASVSNFVANKSAVKDDMFVLPPMQDDSDLHEEELEGIEMKHDISRKDINYLNQIDIESEDFKSLPVGVKQEILSTLKESRKHKNWEYYEALPKESAEFSSYQMQCLLKRRKLQSKLEEIQQDLRQSQSLDILSLYSDDQKMVGAPSKIMSDDCSHYILLKKTQNYQESNSAHNMTDLKEIKDEVSTNNMNSLNEDIKDTFECFSDDEDEDKIVQLNSSEAPADHKHNVEPNVKNKLTHNINFENELPCSSKSNDLKSSFSSNSKELRPEFKDPVILQTGKDQSESLSSSDCESFDSVPELDHEVISSEVLQNQPEFVKENSPIANVIQQEVYENVSTIMHDDIESIEHNSDNIKVDTSDDIKEITQDYKKMPENGNVIHLMDDNEINKDTNSTLEEEILEIQTAVRELEESNLVLQAHQAKVERQATTVQDHMVEDCKTLLRLFGVPYVVSPMEAEAQCAFYDLHDISHGTITDDSDVWLFGGKRVYKNFFAQKKYVEFYKNSEILSHFGLSRMKLINFALLTGSDYTEGIEGVGPVTAMEIISEFGDDGIVALIEFKKWWDVVNKHASPPKNRVRSKLQKLPLTAGFPSQIVFDAYLHPEVDCSMETFSWGLPDLDSIRDYCREKFAWSKNKVDDALLPIIKRLNERTSQLHLDSFFKISLKKDKNLFPSKRIMSALKKINSAENQDECDDPPKKLKRKPFKKRKEIVSRKTLQSSSNSKIEITKEVKLSEESSCDSN